MNARTKSTTGYYTKRLAGERLRRCYEIAPPRVVQYLEAEIAFVLDRLDASAAVLELGCGYGRVLDPLSRKARWSVGIDTSDVSLGVARQLLTERPFCRLARMDAGRLGFDQGSFDLTVCIQNGLSAFGLDPATVMAEALRVTRPGGRALFSSYAPPFWPHRLEWFERQAAEGLVGPIDHQATGDGIIVCHDGFRARTLGRDELLGLGRLLEVECRVSEVDGSSLFCEIAVEESRTRRL